MLGREADPSALEVPSDELADLVRRLRGVRFGRTDAIMGSLVPAIIEQKVVGKQAKALSIGDYRLPNLLAWALAGDPRADAARMLELLEPYRGQRARVVRLLELSGISPPKFGPRNPLASISRI